MTGTTRTVGGVLAAVCTATLLTVPTVAYASDIPAAPTVGRDAPAAAATAVAPVVAGRPGGRRHRLWLRVTRRAGGPLAVRVRSNAAAVAVRAAVPGPDVRRVVHPGRDNVARLSMPAAARTVRAVTVRDRVGHPASVSWINRRPGADPAPDPGDGDGSAPDPGDGWTPDGPGVPGDSRTPGGPGQQPTPTPLPTSPTPTPTPTTPVTPGPVQIDEIEHVMLDRINWWRSQGHTCANPGGGGDSKYFPPSQPVTVHPQAQAVAEHMVWDRVAFPDHPGFNVHLDSQGRTLAQRMALIGPHPFTGGGGEDLADMQGEVSPAGAIHTVDSWIQADYPHCAVLMALSSRYAGVAVAPIVIPHPVTGDPMLVGIWAADLFGAWVY